MSKLQSKQPQDLVRLRQRLDEHRRGSSPGKALPGWAWAAAGRLAKRHGVHRTCRALDLEYNKLKRASVPAGAKVGGAGKTILSGAGVRFLELHGALPLADAVGDGEARVEITAAEGTRLTVRLRDSSPALWALIGALRGRS